MDTDSNMPAVDPDDPSSKAPTTAELQITDANFAVETGLFAAELFLADAPRDLRRMHDLTFFDRRVTTNLLLALAFGGLALSSLSPHGILCFYAIPRWLDVWFPVIALAIVLSISIIEIWYEAGRRHIEVLHHPEVGKAALGFGILVLLAGLDSTLRWFNSVAPWVDTAINLFGIVLLCGTVGLLLWLRRLHRLDEICRQILTFNAACLAVDVKSQLANVAGKTDTVERDFAMRQLQRARNKIICALKAERILRENPTTLAEFPTLWEGSDEGVLQFDDLAAAGDYRPMVTSALKAAGVAGGVVAIPRANTSSDSGGL